jgi:hypothetical protein
VSFALLVGFAEQLLVLAALVGAIWSAIAFVRNLRRVRNLEHERQLQRWQKASVQEMLHRSEQFLTVDEITQHLRSASFDTALEVKKHELSAPEVRLLLLEMLESKIVEQLWGDRYGIAKRDIVVEKVHLELRQNEIIRNVFDLILLAPGHLTTEALMTRLGEDRQLRQADFLLAVHELVHRGIAKVDDRGKWTPLYPSIVEAESPSLALLPQNNMETA